jgi:multidrug efflux pump subunit AcrA (membrane-fusion protein)
MAPSRHPRRRRSLYYLGIACVLSAGAFWLARLTVGPSVAIEQPVSRTDLVVAPGLVEPVSEEISVSNLLQGTIRRVRVSEGEQVVAGQVLAELDNDDLTASVSAAKAQLELRRREREKLINGARGEERQEAPANLQEAEAVAAMAELTLQRKASLVTTHVASVESVDQARTSLRSAKARRDALAEQVALINAPPRREDVAIADANIKLAEAKARRGASDPGQELYAGADRRDSPAVTAARRRTGVSDVPEHRHGHG